MSYGWRLLVGAAISFVGHILFAQGATLLPEQTDEPRPASVRVRLIEAPPKQQEPPPDPEPEPEPVPPTHPIEPRRVEHPRTPTVAPAHVDPDQETPPTERPADDANATTTPSFGVSMESTSRGGTGPSVPIGNTLQVRPKDSTAAPAGSAAVAPLAAPVEAHTVTVMPLPLGRCTGAYTSAARNAGIEGTVVLDIVVGADGRAREVVVVEGLTHGLTRAAVKAVKACRFKPGERDGKLVAVRVRAFKIRFFLRESD